MIKHIGEGLTPFEDCGFDRRPELPLVGESVRVRCRLDRNPARPVLTLRDASGERAVEGALESQSGDCSYYAFPLGAFGACQTVRYQIAAGEEMSQWYDFPVLRRERVARAEVVAADGSRIALRLARDLTLTLARDGSLTLEQKAAGDAPALPSAGLRLSPENTLEAGEGFLWRLKRLSVPLVTATACTVWRDERGAARKVAMELEADCAHIFGTGERFNAVEQRGGGANGRVVEKFTHQGDQTYLPVPLFFTERGWGLYSASAIPTAMRFDRPIVLEQETTGETLLRHHLLLGDPKAMLNRYFALSGKPALPPEWAFGVWISGNGWNSDAEVDAQLAALKRYDYPASVMVLEQWSDEQTFYRWHETRWKDPAAMVRRVRDAGLHLLLWQIPVVKHEWDAPLSQALARDTDEAVRLGCVVKRADGSPYRITENWFHHSLLPDFTNPEARRWWFGKRKYLLDMGVEGFKTDGGEFLFEKSARLFDGSRGLEAHNRYPLQYAAAYHDFLRENGVAGVTFSRAGAAGAQTVPLHWAGDQKSEWGELRAQLCAGLTAGLSGVCFWGFDIGGFAGALPDKELYLRATAMGCFSPVMQWHSEPRGGQFGGESGRNNDRSPWNMARQLGDDAVLAIARRFATLRESLRPYLWREAQACVRLGRPMMAHLCLDFPDDPRAWRTHDEYMLGRDLLVAPVTERGAEGRSVYLPAGAWRDLFTNEAFAGPCETNARCPLDAIPVYRREARP